MTCRRGDRYVDVNREFLSTESHGFLSTLLYITLIGGALTTGVAISDNLPDIELDEMRMSQALGNIMSNAIRCTEAGGSIVISAGQETDEALAVSITDDGIGIDTADLPHVFDRFYRTDQSRSRGIDGTGLGLAITKAIVEAHGGTVCIVSDGLGQGATVNIRIPMNDSVQSI